MIERWPAGGVLLVDTYELLASLDDWLRHMLLPQLPARSLVVIAGRHEPATAWRTDVAWAALTRTHTLGNFVPDESRTYLTRCGVAAEHYDEALAFTRGHPLALSLIADVLTRGDRLAASRLDNEPEVVRLLLETFVREVPSREHRLALHTCVSAWATTEPLLAAVLERPDAHDLFEWLGHLPFVEHGPYGLFPHDLARDVVYMDFRWRDPDAAFRRDRARPRATCTGGSIARTGSSGSGSGSMSSTSSATTPTCGRTSSGLDLAPHTPRRRTHGNTRRLSRWSSATRDPRQQRLHATGWRASRRHFARFAASEATLIGFVATCVSKRPRPKTSPPIQRLRWLSPTPSGTVRRAQVNTLHTGASGWIRSDTRHSLKCSPWWRRLARRPGSRPSSRGRFVAVADPDLIEPMFTEIHMWRVRDADFEIGGRRYGVFAHDWRVEPAREWLRLKAERASRIT